MLRLSSNSENPPDVIDLTSDIAFCQPPDLPPADQHGLRLGKTFVHGNDLSASVPASRQSGVFAISSKSFAFAAVVIIRSMRTFVFFIICVTSMFSQTVPRLADVRRIYIEKMENNLDEYIRSSISKRFHSTLTVVLKREEADAILAGVNGAAQRTESATITLTDARGKVVLWSGSASDRSAKFLDLKHGGEAKLADNLIGQLKKAMQR